MTKLLIRVNTRGGRLCLTGVDYFSTLGYQPGIAFLAAGVLSPIATLVLVCLTLFGALPMYHRVAAESPHGDGSISMLENLLSRWKGKLFVLVLLGFAAISFIITITLSAADAAAHIAENPFVLAHFPLLNHRILVTLILLTALGAIFLKGFKEAIGIAVFLVAAYLLLNVIVISVGLYQIFTHPVSFSNWRAAIFQGYGNPLMMIGAALIVFPKLALGLSGFETGVVVMPHVRGDRDLTVDELESLHTTRGPRAFMPTKFSARWKKIPSVGRLFMLVAEKLLCVFCVSGRAQRPSSQRYSTVAVSLQ